MFKDRDHEIIFNLFIHLYISPAFICLEIIGQKDLDIYTISGVQ